MSGMNQKKLNEVSLPWVAKKKRLSSVSTYVWFEVVDSKGAEVFSTGGEMEGTEDYDDCFNNLLTILSVVNGSTVVMIDEDEIAVWGPK